MKKLYIIDASGYLFRSYYAIRGMTNPKGQSTNALFGFIRSMIKLFKDFKPHHLVAVFDGPNNARSRKELYPQYKSNREKAPDDLLQQFAWARDFCRLMGIPMLSVEGVEADDTMASIAKWAEDKETTVYLCSSDKDLCQCIDDNTYMLQTHKDNLLVGPNEVLEKYGVPPERIIDWLAIVGDTSDNVPGVSGFGPKTATTLLQKYGTLEELLTRADELKGKKAKTLAYEADQARLSKELVTVDTTIHFPREENFFALKPPQIDALKDFYSKMHFLSLIKDLNAESTEEKKVSYELVDDSSSLQALIERLKTQKEICFDTETTATHPLRAVLVGIGFCIEPGTAWYIPCNGNLEKKVVLEALKPIFEKPSIGFYAHNAKYDYHIMQNEGITIANLSFDTILASYLLNAHQRNHSLDTLALEYFGKTKISIKSLIGTGKKQITMAEVPIKKVCAYCCEDVDYTFRLKQVLETELEKRNLKSLLFDIELPLLKVLAGMERRGIYLDVDQLQTMSKEVTQSIKRLETSIFDMAGETFNLNSPKQLSHILFGKMEIPPPKKTATGYSTSADVLEELQKKYPIAALLLDYRGLEKLRSTYIDALPHEVNLKTGRIHCTFNQSGTATGRLASQDPNLQNIPVRKPIGRKIRGAFKPQHFNSRFLSADYSQIELRLLAHFSQDPHLIKAFKQEQDIHKDTAANLFGIEIDQVTKEMRHQAKAVNFGVIYGQGSFGLAKETGMSVKEAARFIEKYFEAFPTVKQYIASCKEMAKKEEKAVTLTGRERAIPEINSRNAQIRNAAERLAVNTPLQGTAADLIKLAMLEVNKQLKMRGWEKYLILQIHDELLFEAPDPDIDELSALTKEAMEGIWDLSVPIIVDTSIGKNWEEC